MNLLKNIWNVFALLGEARYAAELARNHKYEEAKIVIQGK